MHMVNGFQQGQQILRQSFGSLQLGSGVEGLYHHEACFCWFVLVVNT
jgi:hypothetical protein